MWHSFLCAVPRTMVEMHDSTWVSSTNQYRPCDIEALYYHTSVSRWFLRPNSMLLYCICIHIAHCIMYTVCFTTNTITLFKRFYRNYLFSASIIRRLEPLSSLCELKHSPEFYPFSILTSFTLFSFFFFMYMFINTDQIWYQKLVTFN